MKKLFSVLFCFILIVSCTGLAEEVSQEELMAAFQEKLQSSLQSFDPENRALVLRAVSPDGEEGFSLTLRQDDALSDILFTGQGLETPFRMQTDGETAWFSYGGRVYSVLLSEIGTMLSSPDVSALPVPDTEALGEIAELFLTDVLFPAVSQEMPDENTRVIRISLTARQFYDGIAAFGDHVAADERYTAVLASLVDTYYSPDVPQDITPEVLLSEWPSMREAIVSEETDFTLTGAVTVTSLESGTAFSGDLALESEGMIFALAAEGNASSRFLDIDAALTQTMGGKTLTVADLDIDLDIFSGTLHAFAELPLTGYEVRLTASMPRYLPLSPIQAALTVLKGSEQVFAADLNGFYNRSIFSLNASAGPVSAHIYKDLRHLDVSYRDEACSLIARAFLDNLGGLTFAEAAFDNGYDPFAVRWDGASLVFTPDDGYTYTFTGGFESGSLYTIKGVMKAIADPNADETARHIRIEIALPDSDTELVTIKGINYYGSEAFLLVLEGVEKTDQTLLSEQEAIVIDREWVMNLLQQNGY